MGTGEKVEQLREKFPLRCRPQEGRILPESRSIHRSVRQCKRIDLPNSFSTTGAARLSQLLSPESALVLSYRAARRPPFQWRYRVGILKSDRHLRVLQCEDPCEHLDSFRAARRVLGPRWNPRLYAEFPDAVTPRLYSQAIQSTFAIRSLSRGLDYFSMTKDSNKSSFCPRAS